MGDTGGEFAHRRKSVGPDELLGERLDLGDVLDRDDRAEDPSAHGPHPRGRGLHVHSLPSRVTSVISRSETASRPESTLSTSADSPPSSSKT